jgi:hypothetical protein
MQQVLSSSAPVAAMGAGLARVPTQRHIAPAFKPAVKGNKVRAQPRKLSATVRATAAPATAQASPFAAVNSEAALFAILQAGAAGGKVCLNRDYIENLGKAHCLRTLVLAATFL